MCRSVAIKYARSVQTPMLYAVAPIPAIFHPADSLLTHPRVAGCGLRFLHVGLIPVFPGLDLLPSLSSGCLPPDVAAPSNQTLGSAGGCHGRPNIEVEDRFSGRLGRAGVVVDDVADLFLRSVDVP